MKIGSTTYCVLILTVLSTLSLRAQTLENYYGADLSKFPPKVRNWIMDKAFTKQRMEQKWMTDSKLKLSWSEDGNTVFTDASYVVATGYADAGKRKSWGNTEYSGAKNLAADYGEHAKYHTMRFKWLLKLESESRIKNDPAYAQIANFAQKLCNEIEYDWANFKGYNGLVMPTPNKKYYVCDGYSDEIMNRILTLDCVQSVQKYSTGQHAWNVVKLTDGRTLYLDLTWFDNETINKGTGEIEQLEDYDWKNLTFDQDVFRFANIGYANKIFHHTTGKMVKELKK